MFLFVGFILLLETPRLLVLGKVTLIVWLVGNMHAHPSNVSAWARDAHPSKMLAWWMWVTGQD